MSIENENEEEIFMQIQGHPTMFCTSQCQNLKLMP